VSKEQVVFVKWNVPGAFIIRGEDFKLIPGLNEIKESIWARVKENPIVKQKLAESKMVVKNYSPDKAQVEKIEAAPEVDKEHFSSLAEYNASDAKDIVLECLVKDTLENWYESEVRGSVKKVIKEQLKKVSIKKKSDEE